MTAPDEQAGISVQAQLAANLGRLCTEMEYQRKRHQQLAQAIHPISVPPMPFTIASSAGTINQPNLLGPQQGNYWDIHKISIVNFTAGTVTVYRNAQGGDVETEFAAAGVQTFGKAQILLSGNENLVFVAAGITVAASSTMTLNFSGTEIAAPFIGDYLL